MHLEPAVSPRHGHGEQLRLLQRLVELRAEVPFDLRFAAVLGDHRLERLNLLEHRWQRPRWRRCSFLAFVPCHRHGGDSTNPAPARA